MVGLDLQYRWWGWNFKGDGGRQGVARAQDCGFLSWTSPDSHEQMEEYTFYERVENGDLTWILPGEKTLDAGALAFLNAPACA